VFTQTVSQENASLFEYYQLLATEYNLYIEAEAVSGENATYSEFIINNTGNTVLANTTIKAFELQGAQINDITLSADHFYVNSVDNRDTAVQLEDGQFVQIPSMSIGLHEAKNFYLYMDIPQDVYPQIYYGTWFMTVQ
jgi:hypothetical protein